MVGMAAATQVNDSKATTISTTENSLKGSQEEIMFGNQQNKPAGMVDDMISVKQQPESSHQNVIDNMKNKQNSTSKGEEGTSKLDKSAKGFDYYDYLQEPEENSGSDVSYPIEESQRDAQIYNTHDMAEDYDGVLYRRKRTLRPLLMRNIHSNIEELLGGNRRLPRRAMRLKRDTGVEQLVTWLGMLRRGQQGEKEDLYEPEANEDFDLPPDLSYIYDIPKVEVPELPPALLESLVAAEGPAFPRERQPSDIVPMLRYPSPFSRRSNNFYPIDYRYVFVPGQKRGDSRGRSMVDPQASVGDPVAGQWGGFGGRRDNQRLYALANMLAEDNAATLRRKRAVKS